MRRQSIQVAVVVLGAVAVLGGLIAGGRALRGRLKDADEYQFPFTEIQCAAPPGLDRVPFLEDVQYLGGFPDRVPLLDDALPERLVEAFQRHGWVESAKVAVGPGRHIAAQLTFRTPVLAARFTDGIRAVDATGVLLPRTAETQGLPVLAGAKPPSGGAGKPWGDATVEGAARVAWLLHPHQATLKLLAFEFDEHGSMRLRHRPESWPVVIWGRPPGDEADGELKAGQKLQRLLDRSGGPDGLGDPTKRTVIDVTRENH